MQKGLLDGVQNILPLVNHRYCVRHIEANWLKTWRSGEMKKVLWWASWSTYVEDFEDQLQNLGSLSEDAAKDLIGRYPPQKWCRAYFHTVCKNQMVDNNFTESFNSWILDARRKPILKMLEDIRVKTMNLLRKNDEEGRKWTSTFSPRCMKLFNDYLKIAHYCFVEFNGDNGYEVTERAGRHTINLDLERCTCRAWDLSGISCPHAIKALQHKKIDPIKEIHWWYSKEAHHLTYKFKMMPVRGEKFWKILPEHAMEPHELVKTVRRPKVKRTRETNEASKRQGEWSHSRKGTVMTCSKCESSYHNLGKCNKDFGTGSRKTDFGKGKEGTKRKKMSNEDDEEQVEDINSSAPPLSQLGTNSDHVFMSTPRIQRHQQIPYGPESDDESDPDIRPQVISEAKTRLKMRITHFRSSGTRVIDFRGDQHGVSEPRNLPYSPNKLRWKGKNAVNGHQLEVERQQKISKLKARKGTGVAQV